jgi:hypothetical protein
MSTVDIEAQFKELNVKAHERKLHAQAALVELGLGLPRWQR